MMNNFSKKLVTILFIINTFLMIQVSFCSNVLAVGSTGSIGGDKKTYASSVKITNSPKTIKVGQSFQFEAEITPSNVNDKSLTWISGDSSILTIDQNGKAVAKKKGTVKVTVKMSNGVTDNITVTVKKANTTTGYADKVNSISITNNPKEMLTGKTVTLNTQISPSEVDDTTLTFKSSDEKVLKVDNSGKVTAVGKGTASITVTSNSNKKATATIKITVKDTKITLSETNINVDKSGTYNITATVNSNKDYSANDVKWESTSKNTVSVSSSGKSDNKYKATISAKNVGTSKITVTVGGETAQAIVKVNEAGTDTTLECPAITYDTSDNSQIKVTINPASTTVKWDYYTSKNKNTGSNASWNKINTYSGKKTITSKYTEMQGKIRVYGKEGTSRDCYTAPFDLDCSHNACAYNSNYNLECPALSYKYENISGANRYKIGSTVTGVRKVDITITPVASKKYQYTSYSNSGKYKENNYGFEVDTLKPYKTFNSKQTISLVTTNYDFDRYATILVMDSKGDIKRCTTDEFSNLALVSKTTVNGTDIYVEKGYRYNSTQMINIIKGLPKYYLAAPQIFLLKSETFYKLTGRTSNTCAVTYTNSMKIYVRDGSGSSDGCNEDFAKVSIIHELGHSMDDMYKHMNSSFFSDNSDYTKQYSTYKNKKTNGNYTYLRDYSYTSKKEFLADLAGIYYLNNNNNFKSNKYRGYYKIDNTLGNLNLSYLSKFSNLYEKRYSEWNKWKNNYK